MKKNLFLSLALLIVPFLGIAQTIEANLKYINEQFRLYNEYETSYRVEYSTKELICEDRFGILVANINDVEVRMDDSGNNIGIFCLNSSNKCIASYNKNRERNSSDYSEYTMGLRMNGEVLPHINTVLAKFAEIKTLLNRSNSNSNSNSSSGSITSKLAYINEQFQKFNDYSTSFDVDMTTKELICRDEFGILKGYLSEVEVRMDNSGENIGIFCLSGDVCIRNYSLEGVRQSDSDWSEYTMGLKENGKVISNINTVLQYFADIKREVVGSGGGGSLGASNNSVRSQVETKLQAINTIFANNSEYKNVYSVDWTTNEIVGKTPNCQIRVPIRVGLSVEYYGRDYGNYSKGFVFKNNDKSILEKCTSFENYTLKTHEYVNTETNARQVIAHFSDIINLIRSGSGTTTSPVSTGSTDSDLAYINEQFKKYNAYNTRFSVDMAKKQLVWTHDFGTNYANFSDVEVRADYTNGWIGVYCLNKSNKCIWQIGTSGSRTDYSEYTMSLKEGDKMISHMNEVISRFANVKTKVVGGASSGGSVSDDNPDGPDK